jgi:nucleotidyltransferase AbiEii toxin of type IV toxin-antitoxin system
MGVGWPSASKSFAVPINKFQSEVLRTLAAQRSPDSYIAGGVAINRDGPRFSADIDIFHDSEARLESAATADAAALTAAGYSVTWDRIREGKREAMVARRGEAMPLEWVTDAAFRFFPTQPDELFGYVLHPVDLATNKASAAADRRVPRDIVDLVTIHENILPLGAVLCAAVGKFPGVTPEEMLAEITRHSRFTVEEFQALAIKQPVDVPDLHRRIRSMIEDAENFIAKLPSSAVGVIFMDNEKPVQPDVNALDKYQRNPGAPRGFWPSSPEISRAMLERYGKPKP